GSIVGHIGFSLKDPEGITADDPTGTKVAVKTLIDALSKGHFLFDASNEGPDNGVIDPITSLAAGLELSANPTGAIAGLGSLGSITVSLDVPDWLRAPPMLVNDPLGFGHSSIDLDRSAAETLGQAPTNGQLSGDVSFIISDGSVEHIGIIKASSTSDNHSATDLKTDFQDAVDAALDGTGHTVTVGLASG